MTRAHATELGYSLVMRDIDTRDWSRPGVNAIASAVLKDAFPGAIVLFYDGGGDRWQTTEALETILEALSNQGYVFESVCPQTSAAMQVPSDRLPKRASVFGAASRVWMAQD